VGRMYTRIGHHMIDRKLWQLAQMDKMIVNGVVGSRSLIGLRGRDVVGSKSK